MTKAKSLVFAALLLFASIAAAPAQNAPGQEPPPQADPGTSEQGNCISDKTGYTHRGEGYGFAVELTNKCEQRLKCEVSANIQSAKGPAFGTQTLILAPKSQGEKSTQLFEIAVRMAGGIAQVSRECSVF